MGNKTPAIGDAVRFTDLGETGRIVGEAPARFGSNMWLVEIDGRDEIDAYHVEAFELVNRVTDDSVGAGSNP